MIDKPVPEWRIHEIENRIADLERDIPRRREHFLREMAWMETQLDTAKAELAKLKQ